MKPWKLIVLRLLIACLFGGLVTWTALSAGQAEAERSILGDSQVFTCHSLIQLNEVIDAYRQNTHSFPHTLSQIKLGQGADGSQLRDGWGRPFIYIVQDKNYQVISYGQDGKPGGTGWDTDISSDNPHLPKPQMTFDNFLTSPSTQDMVKTAYISGLLAGLLCLITVRPKTFSRRSILTLAVQVLATLAAAALVATIITVLHAPMGH